MTTVKHEIAPGNLTVHRYIVLGYGGAGNVYKGSLRTVGGSKDVAVKELEVRPSCLSQVQRCLPEAPESCTVASMAIQCTPIGGARLAHQRNATNLLQVRPDSPPGPPREYTLLRKALDKCQFVCRPLGYCVKDKKMCLVLKLYDKSLEAYLLEQPGALPRLRRARQRHSPLTAQRASRPAHHPTAGPSAHLRNLSTSTRTASQPPLCGAQSTPRRLTLAAQRSALCRAGKRLNLPDVVRIGKQLADALRSLHSDARIGHFDVKPDNVLLDNQGRCHLCDFSIALEFPPGQTHVRLPEDAYGSTHFMAPEQLTNLFNGLTVRADAWGLGATLLRLHTGGQPFANLRTIQRIHDALRSGAAPDIPASADERFASILRLAFKHNPVKRSDVGSIRYYLSQLGEELRCVACAAAGAASSLALALSAAAERMLENATTSAGAVGAPPASMRSSSPSWLR
jgi:serine/threonine protein kinase